jgi:hypothetical protein
MGRLLKIGAVAGLVGWLHSIGALDPRLWIDTVKHEREVLPGQVKEALEAGKRASAQAEAELEREVEAAFHRFPPPGG